MRTIALLAVSAAAMGLAAAQKQAGGRASALRDWENPAVNSYNRMPAATYAMPLADAKAALAGALEFETPWKMSLNGTWRFRWCGDPQRRPRATASIRRSRSRGRFR